jgi:hypothetical protein
MHLEGTPYPWMSLSRKRRDIMPIPQEWKGNYALLSWIHTWNNKKNKLLNFISFTPKE